MQGYLEIYTPSTLFAIDVVAKIQPFCALRILLEFTRLTTPQLNESTKNFSYGHIYE